MEPRVPYYGGYNGDDILDSPSINGPAPRIVTPYTYTPPVVTQQENINTITVKIDQKHTWLKEGAGIYIHMLENELSFYQGWTLKKIRDNIIQLRADIISLTNQRVKLGGFGLTTALKTTLNTSSPAVIFLYIEAKKRKPVQRLEVEQTQENIWTEESPPPEPEVTLALPEPEPGLIAGLSPKNMMIAGGAVAAVLVLVLIFSNKSK